MPKEKDKEIARCGNCSEEYERYRIIFERDADTLHEWATLRAIYITLCPVCFVEKMGNKGYALEPDVSDDLEGQYV